MGYVVAVMQRRPASRAWRSGFASPMLRGEVYVVTPAARISSGSTKRRVAPQRNRKILVADDDERVLRLTSERLEEAGYRCISVPDAGAVLEEVTRQPFDVLLLDKQMPGTSGLELLEELRQREIQTPVIIMTGYPSMGSAIRALNSGVAAYLVKPFKARELLDSVKAALTGNRSRELTRAAADQLHELRSDVGRPARGMRAPIEEYPELKTLSPREREVLKIFLKGHRVPTIARDLFISPYTVRNHLKAIFAKLGVRSQVELVELFNPSGNSRTVTENGI